MIVEAVGSASFSTRQGGRASSQAIEAAMSQAVSDALVEGISIEDSETIRTRMLAARDRLKRPTP